MPKISVIMPNHNGLPFLQEAVESVRSQTFKDWELIVVDDASSDGGGPYLESATASDYRIKVVLKKVNKGVAQARNAALEKATGRYIAFLDSDDVWLSKKLEKQIAFMEEKDAAISFSWFETISETGEVQGEDTTDKPYFTYWDMLKHHRMMTSTIMLDTSKISQKIHFQNRRTEDYLLWLSMLRGGTKAWCLHEITMRYRHRTGSLSANKLLNMRDVWQCIRKQEKLPLWKAIYYFSCYLLGNLFRKRQWHRIRG